MTVTIQPSPTITIPVEEYNALIQELEILQDTVDALKAKAQIATEGTKAKDWGTFMDELKLMAYSIEIENPAEKAIRSLDKPIRKQVIANIAALANDPRPMGYVQLKGSEDYRIVSGKDYRIIYSINDAAKLVTIVLVGHRSSIYKKHKRT